MINRQPSDPNNPPPDFVDQMATAAGVTPGELMGRPEVESAPGADLLAMARAEIQDQNGIDPEVYAFIERGVEDLLDAEVNVDWIIQALGEKLTGRQLELIWNERLLHLAEILSENSEPLQQAANFLNEILVRSIKENETVVWKMPADYHTLDNVGKNMNQGTLMLQGNVWQKVGDNAEGSARIEVNGNAGPFAGSRMSGQAKLTINGNVGTHAGYTAGGNATIEVQGSADAYAGLLAHDQASIRIHGDARGYAGSRMFGKARLEINGDVGSNCGYRATGEATVVVYGQAGDNLAGEAAEKPTFRVDQGCSRVGVVGRNFVGKIVVKGREMQVIRDR